MQVKNTILRRDVLKIGLSVFAISVLAACGSPAVAPTAAPSATSAPAAQATEAPTAQPTAQAAATDTAAPSATTAATAQATDTAAAAAEATPTAAANTSSTSGSVAIFKIDPSQSQASFTLNEVLLGKPNTVVGKTSKINGVISATLDNPANTQVGT